jgi:cytochrome c oxidase subunit 2
MLYLLSAVFVAVMVVLLVAAFRRRTQVNDQPLKPVLLDTDPGQDRRISRTVISAIALTIVILFVLLVSSFLVGSAINSAPVNDNVLTIEVTGHQWWWDVRYDNPIPSQMVTTANELHIPVGRPVIFKLISNDVIHSFWVPNLHGKTDLVPGHPIETWMQADRPGIYRGQCAEFCGFQHAHMAFAIVAEPEEQFRAWYASQLNSAPAPSTESQSRGQQVFLSKPCIMCHRIQGTDAGGRAGPDLTHVASRQSIGAGTLQNTREHLAGWILDPQTIKPGNQMPPNPMSADDLNALLDYLQSLK